jgi:hypothetical protein
MVDFTLPFFETAPGYYRLIVERIIASDIPAQICARPNYESSRWYGAAVKRFFKRLLRSQGGEPRKIVTDNLYSISNPISPQDQTNEEWLADLGEFSSEKEEAQ